MAICGDIKLPDIYKKSLSHPYGRATNRLQKRKRSGMGCIDSVFYHNYAGK